MKTLQNLTVAVIFTFALLWTTRSVFKIITTTAPDFSVFWLTAKDLFSGQNPYQNREIFTGLGYPVNTLLFYLPLLPFSYPQAQAIFTFLSIGAITSAIFLSSKLCAKKVDRQMFLLVVSLTFLSFPTKFTLGMGQNNAIALLLLLLGLFLYRKRKEELAGIAVGTSIALKTIFGFILLFFILKRRWRLILYTVVPLLISVTLIAIINDIKLYQYWATTVVPPLLNFEGREIYYNQGLIGFVSRTTDNLALRRMASTLLSIALIFLAAIRTRKKGNEILQFSLWVITLLLVDTMSWQHHFVWLIFPFVVLIREILERRKFFLLGAMVVAYFLVSWNFKQPQLLMSLPKSLLLSHTFYGTLFLYLINLRLLVTAKAARA